MTENSFTYFKGEAINPELVTTVAEKWANEFYPKEENKRKGRIVINAAQLRRFYGDVKNMEMRWKNSADKEKAFREILPMIKLLKAKTAYAHSRKLVPESFKFWIWDNVDMINKEKDFKAFLLYFEAVVGFCYGNGLNDKEK